jgi:hypothetical protein
VTDIDALATAADLAAALRTLLERKHLGQGRIVARVNDASGSLGKTTLSSILTGTTVLPRWDTIEPILRACEVTDRELSTWERAHRRASQPAIGEALTTQLDVAQLLSALQDAGWADQARVMAERAAATAAFDDVPGAAIGLAPRRRSRGTSSSYVLARRRPPTHLLDHPRWATLRDPEVARSHRSCPDRSRSPVSSVIPAGAHSHHWRLGFKQSTLGHITRTSRHPAIDAFRQPPLHRHALVPFGFRVGSCCHERYWLRNTRVARAVSRSLPVSGRGLRHRRAVFPRKGFEHGGLHDPAQPV